MTLTRLVGVLGAVVVAVAAAQAQESAPLRFSGSMRGGYWSSTRNLDREHPFGAAMAWLKGTATIGGGVTAFAEGWGAMRGPADDGDAVAELREGFVDATHGGFDLRVGRQIIAWGRADGVNPTGNLAAEDLTLLTPDDADRRLGVVTATATYRMGDFSATALWLPEFRGHRFPLPPAEGAEFVAEREEWPGHQWGLRVERIGGAVDWSMSFYRGLDLTPDLEPAAQPGTIALLHRRQSVFGADAAANLGRIGLRAEGAYVHTEDSDGTDPFRKNPFVFAVVGGDRSFDGRFNLNLQYLVRAVVDFRAPEGLSPEASGIASQQAILSAQTRRVQQGASMRVSGKWLHETLETEWAAIAYAEPRGVAMRPKVTYAATDQLTLVGGAEIYRGSDASLFHLLRPNSATFLEARWGF